MIKTSQKKIEAIAAILAITIFAGVMVGIASESPNTTQSLDTTNTTSIVVEPAEEEPTGEIEQLQQRVYEQGYSYTVAENWITQLSPEERDRLCGYKPLKPPTESLPENVGFQSMTETPKSGMVGLGQPPVGQSLPSSYDAMALGNVTQVRDQGSCGACWIFGTVADFESDVLISESQHSNLTLNYSEQEVGDCNIWSSVGGYDFCDGGNAYMATNYFTKKGAANESGHPYAAANDTCQNCPIEKNVNNWRIITGSDGNESGSITTIKNAILNYGPVYSAIYASPGFQGYGSGVYEYWGSEQPNHAIEIIGWNDSLGSAGAWLIKNSWGTGWGASGPYPGCAWVAYGAANLGDYTSAIAGYKNPGDILFYHDECGWMGHCAGCDTPTAYGAVRFTPSQNSTLTAVDFWIVDANIAYEIKIFDTLNDLGGGNYNFTDQLGTTQTGTTNEQGYYSILLDTPVQLVSGNNFTVQVNFTTTGYGYPIPIDYCADLDLNWTAIATSSGESYASCGGSQFEKYGTSGIDIGIRARTVAAPGATYNESGRYIEGTNVTVNTTAAFNRSYNVTGIPLLFQINNSLNTTSTSFGISNHMGLTTNGTTSGMSNVSWFWVNASSAGTYWVKVTNDANTSEYVDFTVVYYDKGAWNDTDGDKTHDAGEPFWENILDAVGNTSAGGTIIVHNGTYTENVDVDKQLTIQSESGSASTIVNASTSNDHVFYITADYVNISGFTVENATEAGKAGIALSSVEHCNISDNTVSKTNYGIFLSSSSNYNILNTNTVSINNFGIWLDSASNNVLTDNTASNTNYGIHLYSSSNNNTLNNNVASNNVYGIHLFLSSNNNTLNNNTANSNDDYGIYLKTSSNDNRLTNNTASDNTVFGVYLYGSSNNTLSNNTANSNDDYGIILYSSSSNRLTNNTASNNTNHGIQLEYESNNNRLNNNTASDNSNIGIYLYDSSNNNTLNNNTASNNSNYDFYSDENSHNNTVGNLTISSYPTTISFTYDQGIGIKGVTTPNPDPAGNDNISKFVNATNVTANSWIFLNVSYSDADASGINESSLRLYRWNGTAWNVITGSNVDAAENYVYGNVTSFSQIAPLGTDTAPPGNVTGFTATAGDGQVSLSWTNPSDSDFVGTRVIRKTESYPITVTNGTKVCNASSSTDSYTDTGLTNGVTYYYTAFAYDDVPNNSSAVSSAQDSATPTASATPTPSATPPPAGGGGGGGGPPRDSDGDGYSDTIERFLGTDPNDSNDYPREQAAPSEPTPTSKSKPMIFPKAPAVQTPATASTPTPTPAPSTPTPKEPGFEAVFAIAGLLAVAYLVQRGKRK